MRGPHRARPKCAGRSAGPDRHPLPPALPGVRGVARTHPFQRETPEAGERRRRDRARGGRDRRGSDPGREPGGDPGRAQGAGGDDRRGRPREQRGRDLLPAGARAQPEPGIPGKAGAGAAPGDGLRQPHQLGAARGRSQRRRHRRHDQPRRAGLGQGLRAGQALRPRPLRGPTGTPQVRRSDAGPGRARRVHHDQQVLAGSQGVRRARRQADRPHRRPAPGGTDDALQRGGSRPSSPPSSSASTRTSSTRTSRRPK